MQVVAAELAVEEGDINVDLELEVYRFAFLAARSCVVVEVGNLLDSHLIVGGIVVGP